MTSHKTECFSYAVHVAEESMEQYGAQCGPYSDAEALAVAYLSDGTVTCICSELPS